MNEQMKNKKCISGVDNAMKIDMSYILGAMEVKS